MNDAERSIALARIEAIAAELDALRQLVAPSDDPEPKTEISLPDIADIPYDDCLDLGSAASRFQRPKDQLRRWCREHGIGRRRGGRWIVSVPHLQRLLGQ